jgi:hypothetical protein
MDVNHFAKVGEDDGELTTSDLGYYDGTNDYFFEIQFTLIDTKGFENDLYNDLRTLYSTVSEITRNNSVDKIDAWLFFYSINKDINTIERDLKILKSVLGEDVQNHLIIIFTKKSPDDHNMTNAEKYVGINNIRKVYLYTNCEESTQHSFAQSMVNYIGEIRDASKEIPVSPFSNENLKSFLHKLEKEAVMDYIENHKEETINIDNNDLLSTDLKSEIVVDYLLDQYRANIPGSLDKIQADLVVQQENFSIILSILISIIPVAIYYMKKVRLRRLIEYIFN